jgi:hypothetical protein
MSTLSPFSNIFKAVQQRIRSQVPAIQWVDHDLGQLEAFDGERPPVQWPCALLDFSQTDFLEMQGYQDGTFDLVIRLAFDQYEQTHSEMPEYVLDQALTYYELEHQLQAALQAWYGEGLLVNALIRQSAASEKREDDNFRVRRLVYRGTFSDATES